MKYSEAFNEVVELLNNNHHDEAALDAWLIMEEVTGFNKTAWLVHNCEDIPQEQYTCFKEMAERLLADEPVSYILGTREFMGLEFNVNRNVLIPRQDTEHLVEEVLRSCDKKENILENPVRILDLCTGSGCIAISIKKFLDRKGTASEVIASDISEGALAVAKENAKKNDVQVSFIQSDMFENIEGKFDLIVSNPPYIPASQLRTLENKVVGFEPMGALYGGEDGLSFYRIIANEAKKYIKSGGRLFLEIGFDQGKTVPELLKTAGFEEIEVLKDYNNLDRVVKAVMS